MPAYRNAVVAKRRLSAKYGWWTRCPVCKAGHWIGKEVRRVYCCGTRLLIDARG